jgi:subtilisin family serine protease
MINRKLAFNKLSVLVLTIITTVIYSGCKKDPEVSSENESRLASNGNVSSAANNNQKFEPNQLIIKFKAGTSETAKGKALEKISGKVAEKILTKAMKRSGDEEGLTLVHTPLAVLEAKNKVKGAEIIFAEPNYIYNHQATSSDPYFTNNSLWGMKGGFGSQAATAWANGNTGSASVAVGVIDEGVQFNHPDLAGQIWTNPSDPADGIDNDGNGYIDDIHGWDFDANNNTVYDGGTRGAYDDHGTHVAGTIGAKSNTSGVVGMNWNITIIACKFLGRRGGNSVNAIKAVDYLTDLKQRHGINIAASNNSWGGGGFSQALAEAISRANTQNILFIAAAGNGGSDGVGDNNDATASYPSNYDSPNIIAVAAITSTGSLSSFSNFGATTVDLGAPGQGIWSTTAFNIYESYSGTSMATPHVTGAAALYKAKYPLATAAEVKDAILSAARATPTPSLAGKTATGGRLNVGRFY